MKNKQGGAAEETDRKVYENSFKLVGEALVPGASLLVDGRVGEGIAHAVAGVALRGLFGIALGPFGIFAAMTALAANSYSRSIANRHLLHHVGDCFSKGGEKPAGNGDSAVA